MMNISALSLPSELKRHIASFCVPTSLASLTQVHTSYQTEAERILYQDAAVRINTNGIVLLNTLKTRPQKALWVRSLTVEFPLRWDGQDSEVFTAAILLCEALTRMNALHDLRIRLPNREDTVLTAQINQALIQSHFNLHTLHCNQCLDLTSILTKQPGLDVVGIYGDGDDSALVDILTTHAASESHSSSPTLFWLERDTFMPVYNNIAIFPAFSMHASYPWKAIVDSFDTDISTDIHLERQSVDSVRIYLKDFSDLNAVSHLIEEMASFFPKATVVGFVLQTLTYPEPDQSDLAPILSHIPLLREVSFTDTDTDGPAVLTDSKFARAEAWAHGCPDLSMITFFDGSTLVRSEDSDLTWKFFG